MQEYVIYDQVNDRYLQGAVWYANPNKYNTTWTPDVQKARRYKKPPNRKVEKMIREFREFTTDDDYEWIRNDLPISVNFKVVPITVHVVVTQYHVKTLQLTDKQLAIIIGLVNEERTAIRHMLLNEVPDEIEAEDREEMIEHYNELGKAFDLEQWES